MEESTTLLAIGPSAARSPKARAPSLGALAAFLALCLSPRLAAADPPAAEVVDDEDRTPDERPARKVVPQGNILPRVAPVRLSLLAWGASRDPGRPELGVGAMLSLPLGRLGLGKTPAVPRGNTAPPGKAPEAPAGETRPGDPPSASPQPQPQPRAEDAEDGSEKRPARPSPPRLRELLREAYRAAGLGSDGDLGDLAWRARASSLLPELRLRAIRSSDQSARLIPTDTDPLRTQESGGASLLLEARATWRLDRLVFADDEVAVERIRHERAELRRKVLHDLVEALSAFQRAARKASDPAASAEDREEARAREEAAEATLDLLTDGAFSRGALAR